LGVEVVEHDMLGEGVTNAVIFEDGPLPARHFCSVMELRGAEAVATYGEQYYAGGPAVTRRAEGEGHAYFLGALGGGDLYGRVIDLALANAGLEAHPWSSHQVEVIPLRSAADEEPLVFVLNHADEPARLQLPEGAVAHDLLTDRELSGEVALDAYGVALLRD
ncbi:MAG: beta-galactosidase trimerization domain-containing protein, partial [Planctomycetota bacterium]